VNSTRARGGIAEILHRMVPILEELGVDAEWKVIQRELRFLDVTGKIHGVLQGYAEAITKEIRQYHFEMSRKNAEGCELDTNAVLIHHP
jgi:trehalose synthase